MCRDLMLMIYNRIFIVKYIVEHGRDANMYK
jgi:hypothetical protein